MAPGRIVHAGMALYEHLSKLSDAEFERRGISRVELHRRVIERTIA